MRTFGILASILFVTTIFSPQALAEPEQFDLTLACPGDPDDSAETDGFDIVRKSDSANVLGDCDTREDGLLRFDITDTGGATLHPTILGRGSDYAIGLEVPGIAAFHEPIFDDSTKVTVGIPTGTCPGDTTIDNRWMFAQWEGHNTNLNSQVAFGLGGLQVAGGSFVFSVDANISLANFNNAFGGYAMLSSSCTDGDVIVEGEGDRGGTFIFHSLNQGLAGMFISKAGHVSLSMPGDTAPAISALHSTYAALVYDSSVGGNTVRAADFTLDSGTKTLTGQGFQSDGETPDTNYDIDIDFSGSKAFTNVDGWYTGTISVEGDTATNIACAPFQVTDADGIDRSILPCVAQAPDAGGAGNPYNVVMVSEYTPAVLSATDLPGDNHDFGTLTSSDEPVSKSFTVKNTGDRKALNLTIDPGGVGFSLGGGTTCGASLARNATCTVEIVYTPDNGNPSGTINNNITIDNDNDSGLDYLPQFDLELIVSIYVAQLHGVASPVVQATGDANQILDSSFNARSGRFTHVSPALIHGSAAGVVLDRVVY